MKRRLKVLILLGSILFISLVSLTLSAYEIANYITDESDYSVRYVNCYDNRGNVMVGQTCQRVEVDVNGLAIYFVTLSISSIIAIKSFIFIQET